MHTPRICRGALRGLDPSGRSPDSRLGTVGSARRAPSADTGWFPLVCGGMSDTCEQLAQINGDTGVCGDEPTEATVSPVPAASKVTRDRVSLKCSDDLGGRACSVWEGKVLAQDSGRRPSSGRAVLGPVLPQQGTAGQRATRTSLDRLLSER